ncbi:MAG: hypothetical protein HKN76_04405, partial [Saprospiraceae bacterium]|nr:hypothetical protein [Saprospiraceae bacterium]
MRPVFVFSLVCTLLFSNNSIGQVFLGSTLPDSKLLTWEGDIASRLIDSCDHFLLREIDQSLKRRAGFWNRDFSSPQNYVTSIQPNRKTFAGLIGLKEGRVDFDYPDTLAVVGYGPGYTIYETRWPVFGQVHGEGLLVLPDHAPDRAVIVVPDADQLPEDVLGLNNSLPDSLQLARRYAEMGMCVLIPTIIDRQTTFKQLSNREYIYRSAFGLGRHIIGYEIQKILAGVDWFAKSSIRDIAVAGYGEGGLLAFYAGATDTRIDETHVAGYFGSRQHVWQEPAYHNVFGLLQQFGDAEIASLIAPRKLVIYNNLEGPTLEVPVGTGGKPGRLFSPSVEEINAELDRLKQLVSGLPWQVMVQKAKPAEGLPPEVLYLPDSKTRHERQLMELDFHNQWLLVESPYVRKEFMIDLNTDSTLEVFQESATTYRKYFAEEVIGKFEHALLPFNARTRKIEIESANVSAYEVVLDVFSGVFAYGILMVPNDIKSGEKRPVVVCQHGLEGRAQSTIGEKDYRAYKAFATRLAERGYITFAPQNIYIFEDRFRTLQFKANAIKKTLFSIMVPQHQQITNWLGSLDIVDEDKIAFYGLSYGGKSAMRIPPLVDNYCLAICSADFNDWVWKIASSRSPYSYILTGEYEIFEWNLGGTFNYSEMAALIAPRPFMVERGHFDGVAPDERVAHEYAKVRYLYQAKLGIGDRTEIE